MLWLSLNFQDSNDLEFLVRLLHVGLQSLDVVEKQEFRSKQVGLDGVYTVQYIHLIFAYQDNDIVVKFLPSLMELMVNSHLQSVCSKLGEEFSVDIHPSKFQLKQPIVSHIVCMYALNLVKKKDTKLLSELLVAIAVSHQKDHIALPDGFLHQMANFMSSNFKCLQDASGETLLRKFWVPCSCQDDGMLHLCRLLWGVQTHLEPDLLDTVLKEMKPKQQVHLCRLSKI